MLGGVAIADDEAGLIAEIRLNVKTTHSERLMAIVDHALVQSELSMGDIDVFSVAIGPGSFTGLRIGLSTVKGLSFSTGKPVVAVPTLEAFAWNFPFCAYPVCLMLDARKEEVYSAVFRWEGKGFKRVMDEMSVSPEKLLGELPETTLFAGEGVLLYTDLIKRVMKERAVIAPSSDMVPSPANVAMLGVEKAAAGEFISVAEAAPLYIRKSEAELKWKKSI